MLRLLMALTLLVASLLAGWNAGRPTTMPISVELALGNPLAVCIFVVLGALLVYFASHCWRISRRVLAGTAVALMLLLPVIAATPPTSGSHMAVFSVFVVAGVAWMVAYAEADSQRLITVCSVLLVCASMALGLIVAILAALRVLVEEMSPLGLLQRGFLVLFAALAIRPPSHRAINAMRWNGVSGDRN